VSGQDAWLYSQTATVITLKKGIVGGGGGMTAQQEAEHDFMWAYLQLDTTGSVSSIPAKTDIAVSTVTESDTFGVSANDVATVWVDSASYKVRYDNAGTPTWTGWLTGVSTYKDIDSAIVRHRSSASNSTTTRQRFYVSNDVDTFSVTTVAGGGGGFDPSDLNPVFEFIHSDAVASGSKTITSIECRISELPFTSDTSLSTSKIIKTDSSMYFATTGEKKLTWADTSDNPFDYGTSDLTVEAWVWNTGNTAVIFSKGVGWSLEWKSNDGYLPAFYMASGAAELDAGEANDQTGKWIHVVVSVNRDVGTVLYLDGVATTTENTAEWTTLSATSLSNASAAILGQQGVGHIAVLRGYSTALSAGDIEDLYDFGKE
jgi:hypothetical protein